jgi:hypothetical protein
VPPYVAPVITTPEPNLLFIVFIVILVIIVRRNRRASR